MLSRRRFLELSVVGGVVGTTVYGLSCGVRKVRDAASRMSDQ